MKTPRETIHGRGKLSDSLWFKRYFKAVISKAAPGCAQPSDGSKQGRTPQPMKCTHPVIGLFHSSHSATHKAGRAVWTSDDSHAHTGWTGLRSSDFRTSILMLPAPCCLQDQVQVLGLPTPGLLDLPAHLSPSLHPNSQPDPTLAMFLQTSGSCTATLLYSEVRVPYLSARVLPPLHS